MSNILTKTNFPIVGTKFRGKQVMDFVKTLEHGTPLSLRSEFENPYDSSAIAIYATTKVHNSTEPTFEETIHIGYLPAVANGEIAALIRDGEQAEKFVVTFDATEIGKPRCNIVLEA